MSNQLAIATVTATLKRVLAEMAALAVPNPGVSTQRPDAPPATGVPPTRINLYLYQVDQNPGFAGVDLPSRARDGRLLQNPRVGLDLHYMLSFYGDEKDLIPERLLASVVSGLHAHPVLTRDQLLETVAQAVDLVDPKYPFLAESDLSQQVDLVKLTPLPLSLEELSKLWSVFFQIPHVLSVAYVASVVLLEEPVAVQPALPVQARSVYALPFGPPVVDGVRRADDPRAPILDSTPFVVYGERLQSDKTHVQVGGLSFTPPPPTVSATSIEMSVPGGLRAGVHSLQVWHELALGTPPAPHRAVESNAVALVLHPRVTSAAMTSVTSAPGDPVTGTLTLGISPEVGASQKVVVVLNQRTDPPSEPPAVYRIEVPERASDLVTLDVAVADLVASEYYVRVLVDGVDSPLDMAEGSPTRGPLVSVP